MKNVALTIIIFLLILSVGYLYWKNQNSETVFKSNQENKCFSWSVYNPSTKAWRWKSEDLNEYFPSREMAVDNCMSIFNGTKVN